MTTPAQPQIRTSWPAFLTAGATFKIDRAFPLYNNTDWAYTLILAGAVVKTYSGTPQVTPDPSDGSLFHIVLAPADTQPLLPAGAGASVPLTYVERLIAAADGEIMDVVNGRIMCEPNLALANAGAALSYEEQTLLVLEAAIQGRLTADIENYSIAGRSVSKIPARELLALRGQFKAIVWRQRNPGRITQTVDVSLPTMSYGPYGPGRPRLLP